MINQPLAPPTWLDGQRSKALRLFQLGVAAADPAEAVKKTLRMRAGKLEIARALDGSVAARSAVWPKVHLLSVGKGACAMAVAAAQIIPAAVTGFAIAVTNYENLCDVERFTVIGAAHPLPDAAGLEAAKTVAGQLSTIGEGELLLVLVSGGGSALLPLPSEPIELEEKIATTELLLGCGADINQINCVRKHLSQIKGGGLVRLAAGERSTVALHALILSDVLGDDFSSIASGPTVADPTTFADAVEVLKSKGVWQAVPKQVRQHLEAGCRGEVDETPKPGDPLFESVEQTLIGSNTISVKAVIEAAKAFGFTAQLYSDALCGDAHDEAFRLAQHVERMMASNIDRTIALIAGGETTVRLKGSGKGGRNQAMALAFALAAERLGVESRWVFLSGGSDGRDGPTDAAGGMVDPWSLSRIRQAGGDAQALLDNNDAYHALQQADDLIISGATGTNVADLQVVLIHPR